jgi:hypothetical protein
MLGGGGGGASKNDGTGNTNAGIPGGGLLFIHASISITPLFSLPTINVKGGFMPVPILLPEDGGPGGMIHPPGT